MGTPEFTLIAVLGLILLHWAAESGLLLLNLRHSARTPEDPVESPPAVEDSATRLRTSEYTAAKIHTAQIELGWSTACLVAALLSHALPDSQAWVRARIGAGVVGGAAWIFLVGLGFGLADLPLEWRRQFGLEARFGFNTTTPRTWWLDRVKGLLLGAALGLPVLMLILQLFHWAGGGWWWRAWLVVLAFQWMVAWLAPVILLPVFNRLTPLPEGELRDRLLGLGQRAGFPARGIFVMDGSKRSRHANAFFTGFGRFRRIVLFDTLVEQLTPEELEAVLAHEIGHYRRGHVAKMLAWNAAAGLVGFAALAWLARQAWFAESFGFEPDAGLAPNLLLFGLLSGAVLFWASPAVHYWSRRHEFEADAYAARLLGRAAPLVSALRKLAEKSLANLHPHPLYSAWHYSHPTLVERERALAHKP